MREKYDKSIFALVAICLVIMLIGGGILFFIYNTEEKQNKICDKLCVANGYFAGKVEEVQFRANPLVCVCFNETDTVNMYARLPD